MTVGIAGGRAAGRLLAFPLISFLKASSEGRRTGESGIIAQYSASMEDSEGGWRRWLSGA